MHLDVKNKTLRIQSLSQESILHGKDIKTLIKRRVYGLSTAKSQRPGGDEIGGRTVMERFTGIRCVRAWNGMDLVYSFNVLVHYRSCTKCRNRFLILCAFLSRTGAFAVRICVAL